MVLRWRGSRTAAPGGAVAVRTAARETSLLFCVFVSFFPFVFGLFRYSLSASLFLLLFVCLVLSSFSLLRSLSFSSGFLSFVSVFSPFFFFGFPSIYRGRTGVGTIASAPRSGFRGWLVGHHPRQQGVVSLLSAGGRPMTSVGGPTVWGFGLFGGDVGEREAGSFFQKQSFSFCCRFGGERKKRNSVVQNDTVPVSFFFLT